MRVHGEAARSDKGMIFQQLHAFESKQGSKGVNKSCGYAPFQRRIPIRHHQVDRSASCCNHHSGDFLGGGCYLHTLQISRNAYLLLECIDMGGCNRRDSIHHQSAVLRPELRKFIQELCINGGLCPFGRPPHHRQPHNCIQRHHAKFNNRDPID